MFETAIQDLKKENTRLIKKCDSIEVENTKILKLVDARTRRLDDLESYSRCDNLIIRGLPAASGGAGDEKYLHG